jgi:GDP-L-fucose synthase
MNVLVTGSTGFVGRHLVLCLKNKGFHVYESNTKIANLSDISNLNIYNNIKFDYIFHLAAKTKAGDWCKYHKGEQWIDNQILNTNLLNYWKIFQPQSKLISFGTSCSYGPSDLPMNEKDYLVYEPDKDLYTYAMTKRMLLVGCESLSLQYGLKYIHFIPSTLYGPRFDENDSHFIFDLIKKITTGKYEDKTVELWGTGNQKRELIYIDDVINIVTSLLHLENQTINLGCGNDHSIKEFAKIVCDLTKYDHEKIVYNENKFVGVKRKILDINKLLSVLPSDFKFTSLIEGIENTHKYYIDNIYANRKKSI